MDKTLTTASPAAADASAGAAGDGVWTQVRAKRRTQQRVPSRALAHDHQSGSRRAPSPARSDTSSRASGSTAASTAASVRSNRSRSSRASSSVVSTATATSRASTARHGTSTARHGPPSKRRAERRPPISTLNVGASVTGVVIGVQSWGAFVSCGVSKDGLLHACEVDADGRYVSDVTSHLKPGDELTLRVLSVDAEAGRFTLTRRSQHDARHSPQADRSRLSRRTEHTERPARQVRPTPTAAPTAAPTTAPTTKSRAEVLAAMLDRMHDRDGACAFARECLEAARREVEPAHVRVCEAFLARSEGARHSALVPLTERDEGSNQGAQGKRGEGGERGGSTASEEQEQKVCLSAAAVLRGDAFAPVLATLPPSPDVVATTTVRGKMLKLYKMPWATWTRPHEVEIA